MHAAGEAGLAGGEAETDGADRFTRRSAARPGHAGDGDRPVGPAMAQSPFGHGDGDGQAECLTAAEDAAVAFGEAGELHAFEFGTQGDHVVTGNGEAQLDDAVSGLLRRKARLNGEDFVQRRQGGRDLRAGDDLAVNDRDVGMAAATVAGIAQAQTLRQAQGVAPGQPAGSGVCLRLVGEQFGVAGAGAEEVVLGPLDVVLTDLAFPEDAVPAVDAGFETGGSHAAQNFRAGFSDLGRWPVAAVKPRLEGVVAGWGLAVFAAAVIGTEGEEKRGVGLLAQELVAECRNTVPGAGVGIDVDLEGDALHAGVRSSGHRGGRGVGQSGVRPSAGQPRRDALR